MERPLKGAWGMTALIFLFMLINFAAVHPPETDRARSKLGVIPSGARDLSRA